MAAPADVAKELPLRLDGYVRTRRNLSVEQFVAEYPHPVLLHRNEHVTGGGPTFYTQIVPDSSGPLELSVGLATHGAMLVTHLRKRPGAAFLNQVTVGRTRTCDVRLQYPAISKFHAYVTWDEQQTTFALTDADSKNGTFVNGERLLAKTPVTIPERAIISFADYHFRFHSPRGFYVMLAELAY